MKRGLVILLLCLSAAAAIYGESLYLKRVLEKPEQVAHLGDLFHLSPGSLAERPLPAGWASRGDLIFLSARGVERLLEGADHRAAVVGRGVWLLPESYPATAELIERLEGIDPPGDEFEYGFRLVSDLPGSLMDQLDRRESYRYLPHAEGVALLQDSSPRRIGLLTSLDELGLPDHDDWRVRAGDRLVLSISYGGVLVEAQGVANRSGSLGDMIPVTLSATHRRVEALIVERGRGEVRL